jgi:hypothetical protein
MWRMPRSMLSATLFIAALQACSSALDWREVRPAGTTAALLFPCQPKSQSREAMLAGMPTRMTLLACDADGLTFALVHAELGDPSRVSPALAAMATALAANLQARDSRTAPLQIEGMTPNPQAKRIWIVGVLPDATPVREQAALFSRAAHVYQAAVLGPRPEAASDVFFDSLRLGS